MNKSYIPFAISVLIFVGFVLAAIWYYYDRPERVFPYSYKYEQVGVMGFSNGTEIPISQTWRIAFTFKTTDVFSAGTEILADAVAKVDNNLPHTNVRIIFPSAFPPEIVFNEGHAAPAEMPLTVDPTDNTRFIGAPTKLIWRDGGAKCIVVKDEFTLPQPEIPANCPNKIAIEPVFSLLSEEAKLQFESDKRIGAIALVGIAVTALGIGSYVSFKKSDKSSVSVRNKKKKR